MLNLYWKSAEKTRSLIERPFKSEAAFETYLFKNQDILGDVYVIHRQVRTGSKEGIPDMLGVDQDARVCIIELKNHEVGEEILPQALGYAIWAETNPDSVKAIWLESQQKPEDMEIDWDDLDIRIILIAPAFKATVSRMAGKIGYPIDLMQMRRYCFEQEEFLIVETLEEERVPKVRTTKTMQEWDWDYYQTEHGKEATEQFRSAVEVIKTFVENKRWDLSCNLRKKYVNFKLGNRSVFMVRWRSTDSWHLGLYLPAEVVEGFQGQQWKYYTYHNHFKRAMFAPVHPDSPNIDELKPLLIQAYKHISGTE